MKLLYPGSFDPPTLGHLDLIRRAAALCERLVVGVAYHPDKQPFLPVKLRCRLLAEDCAGISNVEVQQFSGPSVRHARDIGCTGLLRGLRSPKDFEAERSMAEVNRQNGFETIFLPSAPALALISSTAVRRVLLAGLSPKGMVSPRVLDCLNLHPIEAARRAGQPVVPGAGAQAVGDGSDQPSSL